MADSITIGTLALYPSYDALGVIVSYTDDDNDTATAVMEYRAVGAADWIIGMDLLKDSRSQITYYPGSGGADVDLSCSGPGILEVVASHVAGGGTEVITTSFGALSGAGAISSNTVTSTVESKVGTDADVIAKQATVLATNRVDIESDTEGATGGIVSGAGASHTTELSLTTLVTLGQNACVEVVGMPSNENVLRLSALNILNVDDKEIFTTGGALSGAAAGLTIEADVDLAKVDVGPNATLLSAGSMELSARGRGNLHGIVAAETYGAGTVSVGTTRVELHPRNEISIAGGAHLRALGDLNLSAGRTADPDMIVAADRYTVEARWDGFAGSAIPISDIDAKAFIVQQNVIDVTSGALLQTGRQANLYAEGLGSVALTGKAKAVSWVSEVGGALSGALGGGGEEQFAGKELSEAHGYVKVNGTVETGLTRHQSLTLTWDGTEDELSAVSDLGVTFTTSFKFVESELVQQLHDAEAMLAEFGNSNPTLKQFYEDEINRIKAELDALGLAEEVVNEDHPELLDILYPKKQVLTVTVGPIWAQAGVIDVRTDQLQGSGVFIAPSDTSVTIINDTPAFLELMGITIPAVNGGLFFNGILMERNIPVGDDDIGSIRYWNVTNADDDNAQGFDGVDPHVTPGMANFTLPPTGAATTPTIVVRNDFDVNTDMPNEGGSFVWPDIKVLGPDEGGQGIFNDSGSVLLQTLPSGEGSIRIEGTVRAQNLIVIAGGQVYITDLTSYAVGGEPASLLAGVTSGTYGAGSAQAAGVASAYYWDGTQWVLKAAFNTATNQAPEHPYSLYGDRIHIDAEYINVNGIMQSGRDQYTLTIDGTKVRDAN